MIKSWVYFGGCSAFIVTVFVAAYAGLIPTEIGSIPMYDSIGHFVLYGLWFYTLHLALGKREVIIGKVNIPHALLTVATIATVEEFAQTLSPLQTFSLYDLFWGIAGMVSCG